LARGRGSPEGRPQLVTIKTMPNYIIIYLRLRLLTQILTIGGDHTNYFDKDVAKYGESGCVPVSNPEVDVNFLPLGFIGG